MPAALQGRQRRSKEHALVVWMSDHHAHGASPCVRRSSRSGHYPAATAAPRPCTEVESAVWSSLDFSTKSEQKSRCMQNRKPATTRLSWEPVVGVGCGWQVWVRVAAQFLRHVSCRLLTPPLHVHVRSCLLSTPQYPRTAERSGGASSSVGEQYRRYTRDGP